MFKVGEIMLQIRLSVDQWVESNGLEATSTIWKARISTASSATMPRPDFTTENMIICTTSLKSDLRHKSEIRPKSDTKPCSSLVLLVSNIHPSRRRTNFPGPPFTVVPSNKSLFMTHHPKIKVSMALGTAMSDTGTRRRDKPVVASQVALLSPVSAMLLIALSRKLPASEAHH